MKSLKTFAAFVLNECLEEYLAVYMGCVKKNDIPILKEVTHLTPEQLNEVTRQSAIKFLSSLRDGTALENAAEGLRAWEANNHPTVPKATRIHPSDLVLIYACQKFSLYKLLPAFAPASVDSMVITSELEQYYTEVHNNAVQLLFKLQQRAEQEVAHKNLLLEEAQTLARIGSWEWDNKKEKVTWSNEMYRIFGMKPQEKSISLEFFMSFLLEHQTETFAEVWRDKILQGEPFEHEFTIVKPDGKRRTLKAQSHPIYEDGQLIRVHGTIQDVTELREAEMEREVSRQKDEFMGIASHELKTPLTSVKAYIDLMGQVLKDNQDGQPQLLKYVNKAKDNILKLHSLIADLLDVSKINAGKLKLNIAPVNLKEVLDECIETISHISANHKIQAHGDANVVVHADKHRIEQVLMNYLTNAVKYSPKYDKVIVNVTTNEKEVQVSVTDFGIGIPKNKQSKVFQRFYRVNDDLHSFTGLGIGLYISSEIIKQHKGRVWFESEEGKGSTFYFSLPLLN
jgi:PAS domain S-box-containing protein